MLAKMGMPRKEEVVSMITKFLEVIGMLEAHSQPMLVESEIKE